MGSGATRPYWRSMAAEDAEMQTYPGVHMAMENAKTKTSPDTMSSKPGQLWQRMAAEDVEVQTYPGVHMAAEDVKTKTSPDTMAYWGDRQRMAAEDVEMQTNAGVHMTVEDAKTKTSPDTMGGATRPYWRSMAAEDAKMRIPTYVSRGEMAANVQLISNGMTPPTNAELVNPNVFQWKFNTSTDVLEYVQSQQNRGIPALITRPESLNRSVDILGTEDLPWDQILMTCHLIGDISCHVPFRSQVFTMAHVRFSDTQEEDHLMFTQHKTHPLCVENCEYMHHISEVLLMKYPLNVTQMLLV